MPELSILMPSIRFSKLKKLYNSILWSTKRTFELIIVSPYDCLPEELLQYKNIKHFKDLGSPSRCLQIASNLAEGKLLNFMADDGVYLPNAIDESIDKLHEMGGDYKNIVVCKYFEATDRVQPPEYYTLNYHDCSKSTYFPNNWLFCNSGLIYREYFEELGGIDCKYEVQAMALIDLAVRFNRDKANIKLIDTNLVRLDWSPGGTGDHQPIYEGQTFFDEPLYKETYKNGYKHLPIKIEISNWKQADAVWNRRWNTQ